MNEVLNGLNPAGDDRLIQGIVREIEADVLLMQAEARAVRALEDEAARLDSREWKR